MSKHNKQADSLRPTTMYEITAKLFNHIRASLTERFEEEAVTLLIDGVNSLIEDQQRELLKRAVIAGKAGSSYCELEYDSVLSEDVLKDPEKIKRSFNNYEAVHQKIGIESMNIYSIMAKMFAHISKKSVEAHGKAGEEAMMEAVRTFGEERGRDIARRAAAVREPNKMDNYLSNYDMGRSELFKFDTHFHPTEIEQTFTKCAFADQWKEDGMQEFGILYCHMIDPAVAKGFNPNFEVIHDQYILKEDEGVCHFRFQMKKDK